MMRQTMNNDLLTDLPVELTAQFQSVNMPLQKIMELEVGGVLPLDLLLDNELVLMAPGNKPIAQGELVIVGNKFGLKITKINLKAGTAPSSKLSSPPQVDSNLLEQAVNAGAGATAMSNLVENESTPIQESAEEDISDLQNELDDLPNGIDDEQDDTNKELEDVGLNPDELDDLEDLY